MYVVTRLKVKLERQQGSKYQDVLDKLRGSRFDSDNKINDELLEKTKAIAKKYGRLESTILQKELKVEQMIAWRLSSRLRENLILGKDNDIELNKIFCKRSDPFHLYYILKTDGVDIAQMQMKLNRSKESLLKLAKRYPPYNRVKNYFPELA